MIISAILVALFIMIVSVLMLVFSNNRKALEHIDNLLDKVDYLEKKIKSQELLKERQKFTKKIVKLEKLAKDLGVDFVSRAYMSPQVHTSLFGKTQMRNEVKGHIIVDGKIHRITENWKDDIREAELTILKKSKDISTTPSKNK